MSARHPSDLARLWRAVRHWPGYFILLVGVMACAIGMVLSLLQIAGWIGPAGLAW